MQGLLLLLAIVPVAGAFLEIDDLRRMVTDPADRAQLKLLDKDQTSPRADIKQKVDAIVAKQSPAVQAAYKKLLDKEAMEDEAEYLKDTTILQNAGASQTILDAMQQMKTIDNDMTLSRREAKQKIRAAQIALMNSITPDERRILARLDDDYAQSSSESASNSSEED